MRICDYLYSALSTVFTHVYTSICVLCGLAIVVGGTVALCIGFLIALILFGVKRYFAEGSKETEKQRNVEVGVPGAEEKQEMEWDNSALNIIVNPLDVSKDHRYTQIVAQHVVNWSCINCNRTLRTQIK